MKKTKLIIAAAIVVVLMLAFAIFNITVLSWG